MGIFVMVIVTYVYGGALATTQEFATKQACLDAQAAIYRSVDADSRSRRILTIVCVPKGNE